MRAPSCPATVAAGKPGISPNGIRVLFSIDFASPPRPEPRIRPTDGSAAPARSRIAAAAFSAAAAEYCRFISELMSLTPQELVDLIRRILDENEALLPGKEGALETVQGNSRQLVHRESQVLSRENIFVGQCRPAHEPVIGVEGDVEAAIEVLAQRMSRVRLGYPRLDVAGEADLQSDAAVVHVLSELRILDEAGRVAEPVGAADVNGLANGIRAITLSGVHRDGEIVFTRVLERRGVHGRGITLLRPREIERHYAIVLELDRQP